ncbi:MAG: hypothetical protein ACMZ64_10340 [Oleiphilus sp.]
MTANPDAEEETLDESGNPVSAKAPVNENLNAIVNEAEKIKQDIIKINQDLYRFQEALLYPTNTQLAIFLSYADNSAFILDSIEINLDGKLVSSALYRESEVEALKKGGIQRVFLGSLSDGKHKLSIQFNGQGRNDRYFRRKKILNFVKEEQARYIQLIVSDNNTTGEPIFKVKQW